MSQFANPHIDDPVKRIATTYNLRGLLEAVTSIDNAEVGSGNVINEVGLGIQRLRPKNRNGFFYAEKRHIVTKPSLKYTCSGSHWPSV